jgi:DNA anti-recombination protein RmuC
VLERIGALDKKLDERINALAHKVDGRFDKVDGRFNKIDKRFDSVDNEIDCVANIFRSTNAEMLKLRDEFRELRAQLKEVLPIPQAP